LLFMVCIFDLFFFFLFSSRRRHTRFSRDWSSDVCSSDLQTIEAHFDGLAGQMRRRLVETVVQQEGGIAAHQAIEAMEEQTAQIGGRRELADLFDIALPTRERSGPESAMFGAVIDAFDPDPETVV